ncbi:bromodomain and WD repeat-containing DDB_G0285837-like [Pecten maximus]|uniref:bromodomain and WD repeat-containing DDB_G0285837-like n=1 Tax=Pecten maximus TaxID=6579 RepID=UPI0014586383|nr:bromodomain and WD repeat-containing DDB_G0285837-like [Pecten maximus]
MPPKPAPRQKPKSPRIGLSNPYQEESDEEVTLEVIPQGLVGTPDTSEEQDNHPDEDAPSDTGDDQASQDREDDDSDHSLPKEEDEGEDSSDQEETVSRPKRTRMQPKWMQSGQYVLSQQPDWIGRANYIRDLAKSGEFRNAQSDLTRALLKVVTDSGVV